MQFKINNKTLKLDHCYIVTYIMYRSKNYNEEDVVDKYFT